MSSSDDDGVLVGDGPAPRVVTHTFVETTGNPGPTEGMFVVPADDPEYPDAKPLATVIPMYNEPVPELWHSLKDLSEQGRVMLAAMLDLVLHVVIVLDGAEKTHRSTHEWLMTVFPPDEVANEGDPTWVQILEDAAEGEDGNGRPLDEHGRPVPFTVVVTRVLETDPDHRPVPVTFSKPDYEGKGDSNLNGCEGQTLELRLTLVIKLDNRKKANTHKYFLADDVGFGATLRSEYLFLTDCGTRFNRDCLLRLCNYLADHGRCAAVTGRQRVMNRRQEESSEGLLSMTFLGRISNLCNYEGSFAVFNGAFALFGLLPVIPGPCGLFRASCLRGEPLEWYFEQTDKKVEQCTQVQAVGHLAEDRYLPVAALLFGALPENIRSDFGCASFLYIGLEPRATFGFQQEPSFERWCGQMRRWIAGAAAFYLDILYNHYADIWNSQRMARVSKIAMFTFYSAQLFVYGQMAFTPALFLLTLKRALDSMSENFLSSGSMYEAPSHAIVAASNLTFGNDTAGGMNATLMPEDTGLFGGDASSSLGSDLNEISYSYTDNIGLESYLNFSNTVWFAVCGLYVLFVAKHVDRHTKPIRWLFAPLGLMGAVAILCGVIGFVSYMCSNLSPGLLPGSEMSGQHSWEWLASTTVMVATLIPIPLAFLYSPWSAFLLTVSMPVFFLLLPTSVALFGSYAFSRLADLGWGSREVADEYTGVSDELKEKEREFDANGRMIAALIVIGNLLLCVFVLSTVGNSLYLCVVVFFVFGFALFHEVFSLIYVLWHLANRWTSQILWDQCCSTRRNRHVANHYEHTGYRLIPGNDA